MAETPETAAARPPDPIFVGGTGRSGTTILGQLIGQHSDYLFIPAELKFHAHRHGLKGVLDGVQPLEDFLTYMREVWYHRYIVKWREEDFAKRWERHRKAVWPEGLEMLVESDVFFRELDRFAEGFEEDRYAAARRFMRSLVAGMLEQTGKRSWIETTPSNGKASPTLFKVFPDMKVLHIVRDGRDVACSRFWRSQSPRKKRPDRDDFLKDIRWWSRRLQLTQEAIDELPEDRRHTVRFESLLVEDREGTYAGILGFLGIEDEPEMRRFFEETLTADRAHIGRYREDPRVPAERADKVYARVLERMNERGVTVPG